MKLTTLSQWLDWIKSLHVVEMDLSLERVREVAVSLNLLKPSCPIVTVGGTNGKGSTVAGLEAIYLKQGYRVGSFTTPFLFQHNEQVRVQGKEASDEDFCEAYEQIEKARGHITLTPFEYNALAAFIIFKQSRLDIALLEVGMGGRWDAVNVLDADVAVVTSIGIDHTQWLGHTREDIAREKAGIFRSGKPAVCGDVDPPKTLIQRAQELGSSLYCQNKEFGFENKVPYWNWWSQKNKLEKLPLSTLALQNMSTVLMTIELLQERLPVSIESLHRGLSHVTLPGRIQVVPGDVTQVFDVSHNPAAAEWLANWIKSHPIKGKTRAVFSMLADKDIVSTLRVMKNYIDEWHIGPLIEKRGASLDVLRDCFKKANINAMTSYPTVKHAHQEAMNVSVLADRVIVFGSFRTVAEVLL